MRKISFFNVIKKKVSLIIIAILAMSSLSMPSPPIHVLAATQNASANPSISANNGSGINWTNPESLASGTFPYASVTLDNSSSSAFLKGTNYNFSAIPIGSIINSITVTINHLAGTNSSDGISGIFSDSSVYLVNKQGATVGADKKNSANWSSYYEIFNYTWTAAELDAAGITLEDIKNPNFGVALSVASNSADMHTASVTQMIIKVNYTGDTTPPVISSVTGNPTSWQNTDVTLTVNAADVPNGADPVSGIPATGGYSFDNGFTWQDSNQKTLSSNQTVGIRVRDAAGNISYSLVLVGRNYVMQPYIVSISKIDKDPPTLTLTQSPSGAGDGSTTIVPTATDTGGSGIDVASFKYADGNQNAAYFTNAGTPFTSSFSVSTNGTYTVYVKDMVGNEQVATTTVTTYTVTFVDYNGTVLKTESVNYGGAATAPIDPTRTGYTFTGWDKTFNNITGDTTVTAQYNINNYTVTFNSQGGSAVPSVNADYNKLIKAPADSIKTGYTFGGWFKEPECLNAWNFITDKVNADITLYAKWIEKSLTGVVLDKITANLAIGDSIILTATVSPIDVFNNSITWSSSNTLVATVDSSGKVTAVGAGTATITVSTVDGGYTATCIVTVNSNEKPVISGVSDKTIKVGDSFDVKAGVTATDLEDGNLTSKIVISGSVDITKPGNYTVTYTVTDSNNNTVSKKIIISVVARNIQVVSIIGKDRFETAVKLSQSQFTNADTIIIVNGEAIADGLGATTLAKYKNAPLLLTDTKSLPNVTINEIKRLKAKNAFIIGGIGVVSDNVKSQLQALGLTVDRISGSDRYGTSLEVAKYIDKNCYDVSKIALANGYGEADALSVASAAGRDNMPIILVNKDNVPAATYTWLASKSIQDAYIIGGTGVVSDNVLNKIDDITAANVRNNRIGGKDRFETNAFIIDRFYGNVIDTTYIAKGNDLIDALAAGPVAAISGAPVVLIDKDLTAAQITILDKRYGNTIIRTGGGISDKAVNFLINCLQ